MSTPARPPDTPPDTPPERPLPPQVTMGLLDYLNATALDGDYAAAAAAAPAGSSPADRSSRRGWLAALTLVLFGGLLSVAAVQAARSEPVVQSSREALIGQVRARRAELFDAQDRVAELSAEIAASQGGALQISAEGRALQERLETASIQAGAVAVRGPGLRIEADDSPPTAADPQMVLDTDLQMMVNGLWAAGAEAVAVNGQRISSLTAIRIAGSAITVNYRSVSPPFVVSAIGDLRTLPARFLESDGGTWWLNLKSLYDMRFDVSSVEVQTLPAVPPFELRHAADGSPATIASGGSQ